MITFEAEIERFSKMGEKTGWTFVTIPKDVANQIKPDCRKSFRVKGLLDELHVTGMSFIPMGEGDFILALNSSIRKQLKKEEGAKLRMQLEEDKTFKIEMPEDLELCLLEERHFLENFLNLPKSHQNYYINWLNTAKTEPTRVKRLTQIVIAMDKKQNFSEMMRSYKNEK
ncbi:YdeI/OmpD-associated family protein [Pedobacter sp. UYP1]|uniref:YdeI/OmpD-associated family protein n=1 Tax=Pedobacter sp. UYP1 TaxID=1756396 RepID=UPI00339459F3